MRLRVGVVNHFDRVRVPGGIRTPNLLIRSQLLYPVELQTLGIFEFRMSIFDRRTQTGLRQVVGFDDGHAGVRAVPADDRGIRAGSERRQDGGLVGVSGGETGG
jgi:hypothetical protein